MTKDFTLLGCSVSGVSGIAKTLLSWATDYLDISVRGISNILAPAYTRAEEVTGLAEGLELVEAYKVESTGLLGGNGLFGSTGLLGSLLGSAVSLWADLKLDKPDYRPGK